MDENFCENETSESVDGQKAKETENPSPLEIIGGKFEQKNRRNEISNRCGSSLDASVSGPSTNFPLIGFKIKEPTESEEVVQPTEPDGEGSSVEAVKPIAPDGKGSSVEVVKSIVRDGEGSSVEAVKSIAPDGKRSSVEVVKSIVRDGEGSSVEVVKPTARDGEGSSVEVVKPTARDGEGSSVEVPPVPSAPLEEPPVCSAAVEEPPAPSVMVERTVQMVELSRPVQESNATTSRTTCVDEQPRVRMAPEVEKQLGSRRPSLGPPPSYSFVMKQKKKLKSVPSPDPLIVNRIPPPTYTGSRGVFMGPEDRTCAYPSFADPIWRSHSQAALCPRCGILVLTTTHAHDSIATHVTALALCLFGYVTPTLKGCWPCCLLPYCINGCKNMYHYCPICQTFLGLYRPW